MEVISVKNLLKYYKIAKKEPGFTGSLKSLFFRKYETVKAVDDISFEINEGELVGFIGPNGAGKTTTIKCLSGLLYPTHGSISVLGYTPYHRRENFLKQIAILMGQKNQLWWDLPVIDSFILNKEIYGVSKKRFDEVLGELSKLLDIEHLLNVPAKKLSLGQRMKMEIVTSLLHSPKILFLDEPTIGLDVVMQKNLRDFIAEYNKKYNATIILTSHYMHDVEALCKRVIVINYGKILYDGELSSLVKEYAPYKLIKIVFDKYVDPKKIEELGKVKKFQFPEVILQVRSEDFNETAAKIIKEFSIADLTIEDPAMEDVIREVFYKNK